MITKLQLAQLQANRKGANMYVQKNVKMYLILHMKMNIQKYPNMTHPYQTQTVKQINRKTQAIPMHKM